MIKKYFSVITLVVTLLAYFLPLYANSAVILQYHHVSNDTPKSTSISPEQFEKHLQYLADNGFQVLPLSVIIDAIKQKTELASKTVAITFDDAYLDIFTNGKPLLDKYKFPYTIFVNPGIINHPPQNYMSWQHLKTLAADGVIIANHGYEHDSLTRKPTDIDEKTWLATQLTLIKQAESEIAQQVSQSWQYFAYPYGEYNPALQAALKENNYIAFTQQSGALGESTDLTTIPRFPASQPYDKLANLKDKLNALAFQITPVAQDQQTIYRQGEVKSVTFDIVLSDFKQNQLHCYVSGLGKQKVQWLGESRFTITFEKNLPIGRVRANCTAPSIKEPGRYYWYSKPWFILQPNGQWYGL